MELPPIVQGGMGIAVSGWPLAAAVSRAGQFGVVSGTGLAIAMAQRLQRGDLGGHLRKALAAFPSRQISDAVLQRWFIAGGASDGRLADPPMPACPMPRDLVELTVAAVFAEIYLAKQHGGRGPIGVNLLTKVEATTLPSLYGAMLAGVDAVFMGAGIPRTIPGVLAAFSQGDPAMLMLSVSGSHPEEMHLDPSEILGQRAPKLPRPKFFPIVSSQVLANILHRKSNGPIDGFVVESHTAGGHNAPPRGRRPETPGASLWDDRDKPSLQAFRELALPFYLAGGQDSPAALRAALAEGAAGVQLGTAFAFCAESGLRDDLKSQVIRQSAAGGAKVCSDSLASPTGFPFKVVQLDETLSDRVVYEKRQRNCDIGYLREAYRRSDGKVGWRCPAEREAAYLSKGGLPEDLAGRKCLCAGLMSASGFCQPDAPPIITAGETLRNLARLLPPGQSSYSAQDVIDYVIKGIAAPGQLNVA